MGQKYVYWRNLRTFVLMVRNTSYACLMSVMEFMMVPCKYDSMSSAVTDVEEAERESDDDAI